MTVRHWFSYHVLLLPVFKVKYPPPSSLENSISLISQIRILKPEKGIGPTKPPALETPLDPLPESKKSALFFTKKRSTKNHQQQGLMGIDYGISMYISNMRWFDHSTCIVVVLDHLLVTLRTLHFKWPRLIYLALLDTHAAVDLISSNIFNLCINNRVDCRISVNLIEMLILSKNYIY